MAVGERACKICNTRRPRRYCPGVEASICPVCCGTEREVTVNCPLSCEYLQEARRRERLPEVDPASFPNKDIKVDEDFLTRNEPLLIFLAAGMAQSALEDGRVVDSDLKDALAALVSTYRTLQSGLYYEARPGNPLAARIFSAVQDRVRQLRERLAEHGGLRDADVLGVLAFLQMLEIQHNNGRPKGRAFIDFLRGFFPPEPSRPEGSLIEVP